MNSGKETSLLTPEMEPRPPKKSPIFFKYFNQETCSERMKISGAYMEIMVETLSVMRDVHIRDKYGNYWPVKLVNIEDKWYFKEGWPEFVKDNSLETGNFVFFQFDGNKVFHVKLIGDDASETIGVGKLLADEISDEGIDKGADEEKEELVVIEMDDGGAAEENEERMLIEINDQETEEQEGQPHQVIKTEKEVDEQKNQSHEENNEEMEAQANQSHEEETDEQMEEQQNQSPEDHADDEKEQENQTLEEKANQEKEKEEVVPKRTSAKRTRTRGLDCYGKDIFKAGILPVPENPYFLTKIRVNRREELYIPLEVLKDHCIEKLPKQATFCDLRGRKWPTRLTTWADGRKFFVGGWSSFCRVNLVGDNDLCICEFVKLDQKDFIMQLQVVPTGGNSMNRARA